MKKLKDLWVLTFIVAIFALLALGLIGSESIDFSKPIPGPILLSTTTVSLAADADTVLYTVPTGKRCILSYAILVISANASTSDISIGQAGAETDFIPAYDLQHLDAANDAGLLMPIPAVEVLKLESYAAGTVIEAKVTNQAGNATNTLYLFGTLY